MAAKYVQALPNLSTAEELAEYNLVLFHQNTRNLAQIEAVWSGLFFFFTWNFVTLGPV